MLVSLSNLKIRESLSLRKSQNSICSNELED